MDYLASIAKVASIGGTAIQTAGSFYTGYQAKKTSKLEAGLLEREATLEANRASRDALRIANAQKLAFIANGIEIDSGSTAQLLIDETEALGEADAAEIMSIGFERARQTRRQGEQALRAGIINSAAYSLEGITSFNKSSKAGYFD